MKKLHLYEDCGSVKNFAEKYLDDNFRDFIYERRRYFVNERDSAEVKKHKEATHAHHVFEELSWKLRIAIADYLEDHEPVEWPEESYTFVSSGSMDKSYRYVTLLDELHDAPHVPMLEIEKQYDKLKFEYGKLTKGDTPAGRVSNWFAALIAFVTLAAVMYHVVTHTLPGVLAQWVIIIAALFSWPLTFLQIHGNIKYRANIAKYKAKKKAMEQELNKIKNSEEYKAAILRRSEMPERIARWQDQMRASLKQS